MDGWLCLASTGKAAAINRLQNHSVCQWKSLDLFAMSVSMLLGMQDPLQCLRERFDSWHGPVAISRPGCPQGGAIAPPTWRPYRDRKVAQLRHFLRRSGDRSQQAGRAGLVEGPAGYVAAL